MVANADEPKPERVEKPINVRGQVRIIKVPPSTVEQYILFKPDDRRYMLDMPPGSTIKRLTPDDEIDKI